MPGGKQPPRAQARAAQPSSTCANCPRAPCGSPVRPASGCETRAGAAHDEDQTRFPDAATAGLAELRAPHRVLIGTYGRGARFSAEPAQRIMRRNGTPPLASEALARAMSNAARPYAHFQLATAFCGAFLLASCASSRGARASEDQAGQRARTAELEQQAERERELSAARSALQIAELELAHTDLGSRLELDEARAEAAAAAREQAEHERKLIAFRGTIRPLELDEARLALDRARFSALESEQELAELEGMYAQEEFAEQTKELVLARGRRALEVARRQLALTERGMAMLDHVELAAKERELVEALEQARQKRTQLEQNCAHAELGRQVALEKARAAVAEAQRELQKLSSAATRSESAPASAPTPAQAAGN